MKKLRMRHVGLMIVMVLILGLLAACGDDDDDADIEVGGEDRAQATATTRPADPTDEPEQEPSEEPDEPEYQCWDGQWVNDRDDCTDVPVGYDEDEDPANTGRGDTTSPQGEVTIPRPVLHHASDSPPELGGGSFDVGVHQDQVGIVFGRHIAWPQGGLDAGGGGCDIVIIPPDNWLENLWILDGRFEVYTVPRDDIRGWMRNLTIQRINEQAADYGCPVHDYDDVPHWTSDVPSPPTGNTGRGDTTTANVQPTVEPVAEAQATEPPAAPACEHDTINCLPRRDGSTEGSTFSFQAGEAVSGYQISIDGTTYRQCYFESAPAAGTVTDGVVNYWAAEVEGMSPCT